jgi:DNA-binding response OmpR family regulator
MRSHQRNAGPTASASPVPEQTAEVRRAHPSVLIADDEEALSELLAQELCALGYECVSLRSKADAFRWSVRHHPDLIITDIRSPEMDGFQFLSLLKSDARTRAVPIVFWTGVPSPHNTALARRLGAAEVVSKPCRLAEVQEVIERLLRNGRSSRATGSARAC